MRLPLLRASGAADGAGGSSTQPECPNHRGQALIRTSHKNKVLCKQSGIAERNNQIILPHFLLLICLVIHL